MSEYTEQAEQFLSSHNLTFRAKFKTNDYYFDDDKEPRDIYTLTIAGKGRGHVSFKFGQSYSGTKNGKQPVAYDLLASLTKFHPGGFEDFCSDFGYDMDSRKAYKVYQTVVKEWRKVEKFFTAEEIEQLHEIN